MEIVHGPEFRQRSLRLPSARARIRWIDVAGPGTGHVYIHGLGCAGFTDSPASRHNRAFADDGRSSLTSLDMDTATVPPISPTPCGPTPRPSRIAGRMPLHCTATGKVHLAFSPPELLEEVLARPLERLTPSTIVLPGIVREQIRKVREAGHAVESEEASIGYCSVAVPLFGSSGLLLGALSITAPTFRANTAKFLNALTAVSRKVAATHQIN